MRGRRGGDEGWSAVYRNKGKKRVLYLLRRKFKIDYLAPVGLSQPLSSWVILNISGWGVEPRDQRYYLITQATHPTSSKGSLPSILFPSTNEGRRQREAPKRQSGTKRQDSNENKQYLQTKALWWGSQTNASVYNKMSSLKKTWSWPVYSTLWYVCFHMQRHNISVTHITKACRDIVRLFNRAPANKNKYHRHIKLHLRHS